MPDVGSEVAWLTEIADLWPLIQNPPHVTTLSHHYYFGGPATNPEVNIPNLLKPATMAKVQRTADAATAAANKMGVRVRMTEGNTCYRGGKPGVSDVFAAAPWAAEFALARQQQLFRNQFAWRHRQIGRKLRRGFSPGRHPSQRKRRERGAHGGSSSPILHSHCDVRFRIRDGAGRVRPQVCR